MTGAPPGGGGPSGFLEFFILEAGDYVEQLDSLLLHASTAGAPDTGAMQRIARALRGSATMAKLAPFAELAGGIERVGRALHQGTLQWNPAVNAALIAAVDDSKILLRSSRTWGASEDQRAATRSAELSGLAPAAQTASSPTNTAAVPPTSFLSTEAANVAAGLELLAARAGGPETAANVLRRVRALRGVAGVKEIAPLADTLEATEDAARGLELGEELSAEARQLLEASGAYLRTLARAIRGEGGSDVNAPSAARDAFSAALENWSNRAGETQQVIPIGQLFFEDGTMGVVETSSNPPTSSSERFRLELVGLGEHLRQIVNAARGAHDTGATVRARRDLKRAVTDARTTAQSFGEREIATFIESHLEATDHIDFLGLAALDDLAQSLAEAGAGGARLRSRAGEMAQGRDLATSIATGLGADLPAPEPATPASLTPRAGSPLAIATPAFTPAIAAPVPMFTPSSIHLPPVPPIPPVTPAAATIAVPSPMASTPAAPTPVALPSIAEQLVPAASATHALDSTSASLIDSSIAALDALGEQPFLEPSPWGDEETVIEIGTLLYRGRTALERAIELRDEIRGHRGGPSRETLDELFDLLELARAE
jgi:hypothetical protein